LDKPLSQWREQPLDPTEMNMRHFSFDISKELGYKRRGFPSVPPSKKARSNESDLILKESRFSRCEQREFKAVIEML
tara:strand:- start:110 stop:340 length:231 start_codon:yes stop_codon:yes gene_type:complete